MNKRMRKPVAIILGAAFLGAVAGDAFAETGNPFVAKPVPSAYELAGSQGDGDGEGNCGEGNCGEGEDGGEHSCGEGNCGEGGEQSCGEGRCGG